MSVITFSDKVFSRKGIYDLRLFFLPVEFFMLKFLFTNVLVEQYLFPVAVPNF